jgi:hypothetical protein
MKKKELLQLIQDLQKRVTQLEKSLSETHQVSDQLRPVGPGIFPEPTIFIPSVWEYDPCVHEYPNPWMATIPPSCKKCGKQAPTWTVTCSTLSSNSQLDDLADQESLSSQDAQF